MPYADGRQLKIGKSNPSGISALFCSGISFKKQITLPEKKICTFARPKRGK